MKLFCLHEIKYFQKKPVPYVIFDHQVDARISEYSVLVLCDRHKDDWLIEPTEYDLRPGQISSKYKWTL